MTAPQEIRPASKAPIIDYETRLTDVTCVACKRDFKVHVPFPLTREQWHDAYLARIRQLEAEVENWRNREASVCPEDFGFEEVIAALHVTIEGLKRSTRRRRDEIIEVQDERNALRAAAQERDRQIAAQAEEIGRLKKAIRYAFQTGDCDEIWDLGGAIVDAETEAALKPESTGR